MTLEKLKAEHPEIVDAIRAEAVEQGKAEERSRIQAIEELGITGHDELINSAKFEKNMTAEQVAMAYIKAENAKRAAHLANHAADAGDVAGVTKTVGNEGIPVAGTKPENKTRDELIAEAKAEFEAAKNL